MEAGARANRRAKGPHPREKCEHAAAMTQPEPAPIDVFSALEAKAGRSFPTIAAARETTMATRDRLTALLGDRAPSDTSVVVFGSLARGEYTEQSDVDWTLLIDGQADPGHHDAVRGIAQALRQAKFGEPGPSGLFGNVAVSHSILHQIGGQDDTNKLTTQRILLLLEAHAVGRGEALDRVRKLVISRYVEDDRGLLFGSKGELVPRFLLNDIVRYWRTVTVDFVYKQRDREGSWALRNAKLRMSRKLIFVSGMLSCFAPELAGGRRRFSDARGKIAVPALVRFLLDRIAVRPLDALAEAALRPAVSAATARALFEAYDAFLGVLSDEDKREHLKKLTFDDLGSDALFKETSGLGYRFQEALDDLFFGADAELARLLRKYGVF